MLDPESFIWVMPWECPLQNWREAAPTLRLKALEAAAQAQSSSLKEEWLPDC